MPCARPWTGVDVRDAAFATAGRGGTDLGWCSARRCVGAAGKCLVPLCGREPAPGDFACHAFPGTRANVPAVAAAVAEYRVDVRAVRREECDGVDVLGPVERRADRTAARDIPEPDLAIAASAHECAAIGAHVDA